MRLRREVIHRLGSRTRLGSRPSADTDQRAAQDEIRDGLCVPEETLSRVQLRRLATEFSGSILVNEPTEGAVRMRRRIIWAGRLVGISGPSSTASIVSALPGPPTRGRISRPALRTGAVNVKRAVSNLGTKFATASRSPRSARARGLRKRRPCARRRPSPTGPDRSAECRGLVKDVAQKAFVGCRGDFGVSASVSHGWTLVWGIGTRSREPRRASPALLSGDSNGSSAHHPRRRARDPTGCRCDTAPVSGIVPICFGVLPPERATNACPRAATASSTARANRSAAARANAEPSPTTTTCPRAPRSVA